MGDDYLAVAIAVVEASDHFLVGLRPAGKPLAGYWEFPGGRVEVGESAAQAAVRECLEETGIAVSVRAEYSQHLHTYDYGSVLLRFFACRPDALGCPTPRPPFQWVPRPAMAELKFPGGNAILLQELLGQ